MAKKKLTELEKKIRDTKLPKINYKEHNSVSFSQYSTWLQCPHKWYLTHVLDKAPFDSSGYIYLVFGNSMHETLQNYLDVMYSKSGAEADRIDLEAYFNERFVGAYKKFYEKHGRHFSTSEEMNEFYEEGVAILNYFKKKRGSIFSKKNYKLLGIELPLVREVKNNVYLRGYIDVALYHTETQEVEIYDFKTSTRGWYDEDKKDESKTSQLILYKDALSKQYDIDPEKIKIEFIILKRKIPENTEYPIPRIQRFSPSNGKRKLKEVSTRFNEFLNNCFDAEGDKLDKVYSKNPSDHNCMFCPFKDNIELCDRKIVL